jgi:hypothetical protein
VVERAARERRRIRPVTWRDPQGQGASRPHAYELYEDGRRVGDLRWRGRPRRDAGWYLTVRTRRPQRLSVDPAIDTLAQDVRSSDHDWELNAELSAILSTALALDAAERVLHPRQELARRRFNRLSAGRYEIHVTGVEPTVLAHAVPELPLSAVSDVRILEGELHEDALRTVLRRIALLGGRVVAMFRTDDD